MDDNLLTTTPEIEPAVAVDGETGPSNSEQILRPSAPTIDIGELASTLEALLITSGRAVPAARLAVALGIAPTEDAAAQQVTASRKSPVAITEMPVDAEGTPIMVDEAVQVKPRRRKAKVANGPSPEEQIAQAVSMLNSQYVASHRSFRIEQVAGGYRFMTLPKFGKAIAVLQGAQSSSKLSRAAVESLAIIAYKQPVTKATLEAIRGVSCGEVLKSLTDRRLITVAGRSEELGRPILYATTKAFLEAFGLASLKDLPTAAELQARA